MTRLHAPTPRRRWAAALAVAALATLAACGGTTEASDPPPTTPFTTATPSPTPTKPTWAAKYTDAQYADYLAALARYKDYLAHDGPWLNSDPKAAIPMVREYFTPDEAAYQLKLIAYDHRHKLTANRNPDLLWARMTVHGTTMQRQPQVVMQTCMDGSRVTGYQDGKVINGNGGDISTPVIATVTMGKTPKGKWLIARLINPGVDQIKVRRCSANDIH